MKEEQTRIAEPVAAPEELLSQSERESDFAVAEETLPAKDEGKKAWTAKRITGMVFLSLGLAVVLFLLFVAVVLAVDKFVKKSPVPSFFGHATLIVTTGSMAGTIEEGDMIAISKADDYKIGDIVTFLAAGDTTPTTHRIIRVQDGKYYTKGDANNAEDTHPIEKSEIVGKVTRVIPHVGLFFRWLKEDFGWMYLVACGIVIVAGVMLLRRLPAEKKE